MREMPDERAKLSELLTDAGLRSLAIDRELAERFGSLPPLAEGFDELGWEFYKAFVEALGPNLLVECISNIAPRLAELPPETLATEIAHPVIGWDSHLLPDEEDPLFRPFLAARFWLNMVLKGDWAYNRETHTRRSEQAEVPVWPLYCFVEMARQFVVSEPESYKSPVRARAFVRFDHDRVRTWYTGRPKHRLDKVCIRPRLGLRRPGEARADFVLEVLEAVAEEAVRQVVENAEMVEELSGVAMSPERRRHARTDIPKRARECAHRLLDLPHPKDGSSRSVQDRLLRELGFLTTP